MIAANELRIGNLAYNQYGKIGTVWGFKVGDATHDFEHIVSFKELNVNSCYSRYIKPIPLTPEILEKCGFEKDNDGIYSKLGFMFWLDDIGVMQLALNYSPICNAPCKYVHQLQNLIYALTGEEITFKP